MEATPKQDVLPGPEKIQGPALKKSVFYTAGIIASLAFTAWKVDYTDYPIDIICYPERTTRIGASYKELQATEWVIRFWIRFGYQIQDRGAENKPLASILGIPEHPDRVLVRTGSH